MADPLPPDPYLALGVARDATCAEIKTQYRKLALKFHPDKVQDEAQKATAADEFHKIQTAYEVVGDETRRSRYDAQCRLNDLKKEMTDRGVRANGYSQSSQPARAPENVDRSSSKYEESRPSFASHPEYSDLPARATSRKDAEYERSSKRSSPRVEREKSRTAVKDPKEIERSNRREKSRRTDRDIRRDRERKQPVYSSVEEDDSPESAPDERERARERRRRRDDEELRRARDIYHEQARRQQEEAAKGVYGDERARKFFSNQQERDAHDYIERSAARANRSRGEPERRPSPVRAASSKDKIEYIRREGGQPPIMIRRGTGRVKTAEDVDQRRSTPRHREIVDEPRGAEWKVPSFNPSKSAPGEIRIPGERQRSRSTQLDADYAPPIPQMMRSKTMPVEQKEPRNDNPRRRETAIPTRSSGLRGEPQMAYPTPEHSPEPAKHRFHYGQEYADDGEYAHPDGYRFRETTGGAARQPIYTRSPSPKRERERDRDRSDRADARRSAPIAYPSNAAANPPAPRPIRTTSTSYAYAPQAEPSRDTYSRPSPIARENSGRNTSGFLYGEIPTTASPIATSPIAATTGAPSSSRNLPRQSSGSSNKYSPVIDSTMQFQSAVHRDDIKFQTGYVAAGSSSRRAGPSGSGATPAKPSYTRQGSGAVRVQ